ncbi:FBA_3 domain-containing protein [Cephalotus follicularis]|uniref:FBA_3 domain-containing protein n=1 Tax=Cephalotus follicularis TaxID=3775 RepID=A0A1Q3C1W3_CEPFO|nr:FBA_3 domain-containing protein [Cephalotus follicularis]
MTSKDSYGIMLSSSGKYKVVRLFLEDSSHIGCEIFTVGSRSWRAVNGPSSGLISGFRERPVSAQSDYIVSMDIDKEKFLTITLPTVSRRYDRIFESSGFLGFVTHAEPDCIEIWILKDLCGDNWLKEHSIIGSFSKDYVLISALGNGREVFLKKINGDKFHDVYNYELQELKKIKVDCNLSQIISISVPHVNSLASWEALPELW